MADVCRSRELDSLHGGLSRVFGHPKGFSFRFLSLGAKLIQVALEARCSHSVPTDSEGGGKQISRVPPSTRREAFAPSRIEMCFAFSSYRKAWKCHGSRFKCTDSVS